MSAAIDKMWSGSSQGRNQTTIAIGVPFEARPGDLFMVQIDTLGGSEEVEVWPSGQLVPLPLVLLGTDLLDIPKRRHAWEVLALPDPLPAGFTFAFHQAPYRHLVRWGFVRVIGKALDLAGTYVDPRGGTGDRG